MSTSTEKGQRILEGEAEAIRADATRQINELRAVASVLWPDRDDPTVQSELTVVLSKLRGAEEALREHGDAEPTDTPRAAA
jgi:hypothetical protein